MNKAVIGLGFGDEGKGLVTAYLASQDREAIVVRFNGGHQAGHHVRFSDESLAQAHTFSSLGSGTLTGNSTYWSSTCTIYPVALMNEVQALSFLGFEADLNISDKCPIVTPWDINYQRRSVVNVSHGTVGVGFGTTLVRQSQGVSLVLGDLYHPAVLKEKLNSIRYFYGAGADQSEEEIEQFMLAVSDLTVAFPDADTETEDRKMFRENLIFEGAQGLMLDAEYGFFPHVTRSRTGVEGIHKSEAFRHSSGDLKIYYVTRAYQTRHGNGPMTGTDLGLELKNTQYEINKSHKYQGEFRIKRLDLDLIRYAIQRDNPLPYRKNLVITCVDQTGDEIPVIDRGVEKQVHYSRIPRELGIEFEEFYISRSPFSDLLERVW